MFCTRLLACAVVLFISFDIIFSIVKDRGIREAEIGVRGEVEEGVLRDSALIEWRRVDCVRRVFAGLVNFVALVLI